MQAIDIAGDSLNSRFVMLISTFQRISVIVRNCLSPTCVDKDYNEILLIIKQEGLIVLCLLIII